MERSGHSLSEVLPQHLLEGTEKSQWKSVRLDGVMDKIHTIRTNPLFISQSTSVCPYPSSYHNSQQVHILHPRNCHHMLWALHLAKYISVDVNAQSKSDDGRHIAVKTLCNNTPNSSPQYTQVPLQNWADFIIPSGFNLSVSTLSNTFPKECDCWGQL
jgi:hypothetical protein